MRVGAGVGAEAFLAFNNSLRGDVGFSCIADFQRVRLSGKYNALNPLTSSTIFQY